MQSRKPAGSGLQFVFYALAALALLIGLVALIGVLALPPTWRPTRSC